MTDIEVGNRTAGSGCSVWGVESAGASNDMPVAAAGSPSAPEWKALLDEVAFGIAVVDRSRRLVYANCAARAALEPLYGLQVRAGLLEARATGVSQVFRDAVDAAFSGRRRFVTLGTEAASFGAVALPMAGEVTASVNFVAWIFERDAGSCGLGMYFFAKAFRITAAEQRVLSALAQGASVVDAAADLGCAQNTARTHVRSLLQKTGLSSLRRLIAKVGALPPVASRYALASRTEVRGEGPAVVTGHEIRCACPQRPAASGV